MVLQHGGDYDWRWTAIASIAEKIGWTAEILRLWVRKAERNSCQGDGGSQPSRAYGTEFAPKRRFRVNPYTTTVRSIRFLTPKNR
jgi:transposase-like protein